MPKWLRFLLAVLVLITASVACDESGDTEPLPPAEDNTNPPSSDLVVPKGDRILELDANAPEVDDYDQVMELARELGVDSIRLSVYWDDIEVSPGQYQPDPNWLAIADQYYSAQGFSISLVISVLDTTEIRVPKDLQGRRFNDPELAERFLDLLDYIKTQLVEVELISIAIGNEIDGVLGNDPQDWKDYQIFYEKTADYARILWPDIPVSTKVTFDGLMGPMAASAGDLYQSSSVVMTTYYPLKGDFSVKDPSVVLNDFQALVEAFPNKEIHLTEIGYPTSQFNSSSPEKQASFINYMFQAWDKYSDQIRLLSYSWLTDLPPASVKELESYYGLSNQAFGEFLRTLGLRTYPGTGQNKPGFDQFQQEAQQRGW
jgi:hypothetical protein